MIIYIFKTIEILIFIELKITKNLFTVKYTFLKYTKIAKIF